MFLRHLIPILVLSLIVAAWFFIPSRSACELFGVAALNCSSWTSGLFGVGIGGGLTLWASWYFGDKSSNEIATKLNNAVDKIIEKGSEKFVSELKEKLEKTTSDLEKALPHKTVQAIQSRAMTTALLASGPLVEKLLPQIVGLIYALLPDEQKQCLEAMAKEKKETDGKPKAAQDTQSQLNQAPPADPP